MDEIKTILLVDDNKTTLQLNKWLLKDFFLEDNIYMESSGKDALEFIRINMHRSKISDSFFPLLIICDVQMPDIGGREFVDILNADKEIDMNMIYIVLLSAYFQPQGPEQKCTARNVTCINKPLMDSNIDEIKQTFALAF